MDTSAETKEITTVREFKSGAMLGIGCQDNCWLVFERSSASDSWRRVPKMEPMHSSGQARQWCQMATSLR
jgi:hypothetical protein